MGIDGQRLSATDIANGGFDVTVEDLYIIVQIPVGAVGGYFKVGCTPVKYSSNLHVISKLLRFMDVVEVKQLEILFQVVRSLPRACTIPIEVQKRALELKKEVSFVLVKVWNDLGGQLELVSKLKRCI